jgi:hypothetical protein
MDERKKKSVYATYSIPPGHNGEGSIEVRVGPKKPPRLVAVEKGLFP